MHSRTVAGSVISLLFTIGVVVAIPLQGEVQPSDSPAYYKAKCVICHGQKAEKKFDATMAEEQMVEAVLKGKKAEKPPHMPGFESKGVNADQAKALIAYMKQLKESAPTQ
jgi:cytochrome c